jgi:hypothetical protein
MQFSIEGHPIYYRTSYFTTVSCKNRFMETSRHCSKTTMLQRLQKSFHSSLLNCTILLARARWHPTTLTTFPLYSSRWNAHIVRWLGATLCKLGVQAKKLHFHNQESILNNTGYCHILKYGKNFLSYFHT